MQRAPASSPPSPDRTRPPRPEARRLLSDLLSREPSRDGGARVGPASAAQERLWFLDQLDPGSNAYNVTFALRLAGPLDVQALERALTALRRRHESLRTVFNILRGQVLQVVRPASAFELPSADLRGEPDAEAAARALCTEAGSRPFSLTEGPLFRAFLLRLGDEEHVLALTAHHIVVDGRSFEVLLRDLGHLYLAGRGRADGGLPELRAQYLDYTFWQRERVAAGVLASELTYWHEQLAGAPQSTDLPLDRPRPSVREVKGATIWRDLAGGLREDAVRVAASERATPFMIMLAVYAELVGRWAAQDTIVIGTPVVGRTRAEFEDTVGCFVNTVALRVDLSGGPTFRELLARIRKVTLGAFAHQEVPFDQVVQELAPDRDLTQTPIFQIAFSYESALDEQETLGELEVTPFPFLTDIVKFDVELAVIDSPTRVQVSWSFNEEVLDEKTIVGLAVRYERLLAGAVAEPERPLRNIPLPGSEGRRLVAPDRSTASGKLGREAAAPAPFVAPQTPVEHALVGIWGSVLRRERISTHDNFFSIGGNSIRALQVTAAICEELGVVLPVASLFTHQAIAPLAALVEQAASAAARPAATLVRLQDGISPPLVVVHPVGGGVFCYQPLVAALPAVSIYGFEAAEPHRDSLAALAERYASELLARGPEPPVVLAGWSMGGVIAFEMARALERQQSVSLPVVLVDSHVGPFQGEIGELDLAEAFVDEISLGSGIVSPDVRGRDSAREAIAAALASWQEEGVGHGFDLDALLVRFEIFCANHRALCDHRQEPYGGPVYLIEAPRSSALAETWKPLAPRLSSRIVEGDHFTLLQSPSVGRVAETVRRALAGLAPPAQGGESR